MQEKVEMDHKDMIGCPSLLQRGRLKPEPEKALKCPRCESTNTKFCYYNNYNLSQPRYLCKTCKHYWTKGDTLRDVPVGGCCKKKKRIMESLYSPIWENLHQLFHQIDPQTFTNYIPILYMRTMQ